MNGITFRGKHSREFGIVVRTLRRPPIAPVKQFDEEIAFHDGNADYSEAGGRLFYQDKVLELEFGFISRNLRELNKSISKFISWLAGGYGDLIFDDMPFTIWRAKPVDLGDVELSARKNGRVTVQFRCRPFNSWIFSSEGMPLDSDIQLDSNVPLGFGDENEIDFAIGSNSYTLDYYGTAPIRPIIVVTSSGGVALSVNSKVMAISEINGTAIIDCAKGTVENAKVGGRFIEIQAGENKIQIVATAAGSVKFNYIHNFLYGGDF